MHMGFQTCLAVPTESAVSKVDVDSEAVIQRLPYPGDLFALCDGIGGNKSRADICSLNQLSRLKIPTRHIVNFSGGLIGLALFVYVDGQDVLFLLLGLQRITHKRRIAHNVIQLVLGHHALPVQTQGVPLNDIRVGFQGKEIKAHVDDIFGFLHHLALGNPQGGLGYGHGKIVDLNPVKLPDGDLDRVTHIKYNLVVMQQGKDLIFQPPQGKIGFCQKVSRTAGGVEEGQAGQLLLERLQLLLAGALHWDFADLFQFGFQPIQKQRVNYFVDVLNAGVMHSSAATGLRVQRAFKDRTKDSRADGRPVKILTCPAEDQRDNFLIEPRDNDVLIGKQATVDIGEGRQIIIHIGVAFLRLLVEHPEQVDQSAAGLALMGREIIMEHQVTAKNPSVLGIQAEHQTDAQGVQAFQRFRVVRVLILFQKRIVQHADKLASLQGDVHFLFDMVAGGVDDKLQPMIFFFQIRQIQDFRLVVGAVHIVDMEFPEIADDDPPGLLGLGHISAIPAGLLIGRQKGAVRLPVPFSKVNILSFLLDQHPRLRNVPINEFGGAFSGFGVIHLDTLLKADVLFRFLYAKNLLQKRQPKCLCLLLFVATPLPVLGELFGRCSLFCIVHNFLPVKIFGIGPDLRLIAVVAKDLSRMRRTKSSISKILIPAMHRKLAVLRRSPCRRSFCR